ncbi:hypothetical protein SAMN05216386_0101 [Nitrosospira briensis]|uniref:Uncharacterized protein n=1 Tax=Nitrosospira briensis TaxID=35799 RepID=A0A1I4XFY4_9PROT|nr:hypothetical protein [Nitrosospira briensis]SFN24685.1 hypothetical protein SAMN05216386_0101 [Nitrosospira briensis]
MDLSAILQWAEEQGALANILQIIGSMATAAGAVYAVMKRRFKRDKLLLEHAEARLALKNEELAALKQERDEFKQYDPVWLRSAEEERKEENEEKAVAILRTGIILGATRTRWSRSMGYYPLGGVSVAPSIQTRLASYMSGRGFWIILNAPRKRYGKLMGSYRLTCMAI